MNTLTINYFNRKTGEQRLSFLRQIESDLINPLYVDGGGNYYTINNHKVKDVNKLFNN